LTGNENCLRLRPIFGNKKWLAAVWRSSHDDFTGIFVSSRKKNENSCNLFDLFEIFCREQDTSDLDRNLHEYWMKMSGELHVMCVQRSKWLLVGPTRTDENC
jgi:hypothetical protein